MFVFSFFSSNRFCLYLFLWSSSSFSMYQFWLRVHAAALPQPQSLAITVRFVQLQNNKKTILLFTGFVRIRTRNISTTNVKWRQKHLNKMSAWNWFCGVRRFVFDIRFRDSAYIYSMNLSEFNGFAIVPMSTMCLCIFPFACCSNIRFVVVWMQLWVTWAGE